MGGGSARVVPTFSTVVKTFVKLKTVQEMERGKTGRKIMQIWREKIVDSVRKTLTSRQLCGQLVASSEAKMEWAKSNTAGQKATIKFNEKIH